MVLDTSPGPKRKQPQFTAGMKKNKVPSYSSLKNAAKVGRPSSSESIVESLRSVDSSNTINNQNNITNNELAEPSSLNINDKEYNPEAIRSSSNLRNLQSQQNDPVSDHENVPESGTESEETDEDGLVTKGSKPKSADLSKVDYSRFRSPSESQESQESQEIQNTSQISRTNSKDNDRHEITDDKVTDIIVDQNVTGNDDITNMNMEEGKHHTGIDTDSLVETDVSNNNKSQIDTNYSQAISERTSSIDSNCSDITENGQLYDTLNPNMVERTVTPHDSTITLTKETKDNASNDITDSFKMHQMFALPPHAKIAANKYDGDYSQNKSTNTDTYIEQSMLPQEPKVIIPSEIESKDSTLSTPNSTTSGISSGTNQDSLIFQQSGLTLYNFNTQGSTKNFNHSSANHMNQFNRNISQQSLKRQESYLTFRVPDNHQKNLHMTNNTDTLERNLQMGSASTHNTEQSAERAPNLTRSEYKPTTSATNSLLSQQKKIQDEKKISDMLDLDISSYLSTQEPETDSRTQQKLWLQRENVATLNVSEDTVHAPAVIINQSTRFQYEQHSKEFLHIRRYLNPMLSSLNRLKEYSTSKRRVSIDNGAAMDTSTMNSKSVRLDASLKSKFQSTSLAKSIRFSTRDNQTQDILFKPDLTESKNIVQLLWNKNCDDFIGESIKPIVTENVDSTQLRSGQFRQQPTQQQPTQQQQQYQQQQYQQQQYQQQQYQQQQYQQQQYQQQQYQQQQVKLQQQQQHQNTQQQQQQQHLQYQQQQYNQQQQHQQQQLQHQQQQKHQRYSNHQAQQNSEQQQRNLEHEIPPLTNGASPHFNYPNSEIFSKGNNTPFGQTSNHNSNPVRR